MRASSLTNLGVGVDYNISSDYDKVLVVAGLASEIEELAPHANEIANLVANLPDVLTVQEASELVNNLTVKVTTLPAGSTATSDLVGTEIRLGIPAGTQGVQGLQGPKGDKGDKGDIGLTGSQGPIGLTGPQGPRGLRGNDGVDGAGVEITSILNNPNKSLTINFSDGTQHTTDPLKGQDGTSVTVTNVVNNPNGTMQINFSDGTSHTTANLTGPRGFKGDTGDHLHHISYQRSKDALGNEVGPVTPSQRGYTDTYAMWLGQEELPEMYIGEFTVCNGLDTLTTEERYKFDSIEFGATADQTASEILTLLKTVDGSGSGIDADLLDGQEGAYYLNASNINTGTINDSYLPNTITSDITGNAATATKLSTSRTISLTGDVTGNVSFDGSANVSISTTIQPNSVALGTDTTGNYTSGVTAGAGITVTGVVGEGWTPSIALAPVGTPGTYTKVSTNDKGQVVSGGSLTANDIPNLDASKITSGIIDAARLPAYVDDVLEYANLSAFPAVGESGKIYIALDTNKAYRWSGSTYVYITSGAVDSVAGKTGVVTLVKADVGLSNVDNTSDVNKPVSTATQTALNSKVDKVAGKQLSTEDYTTAEKTKLSGIAAGAQVNVPTDLSLGTATGTTLPLNSSTGTDVVLPAVTTTTAGLMSSTDKTKLDGIATGANNYVLPIANPVGIGGVKVSATAQTIAANAVTATASRTYAVQLDASGNALVNVPWVDTNTVYTHPSTDGSLHVPATSTTNNGKVLMAGATAGSLTWSTLPSATTTTPGYMSAADKTKLDGIANTANNYVHPSTHDAAMITVTDTFNNSNGTTVQVVLDDLDNAIDVEKGRIDAILSASAADKDSFAEIVTLINSVDTTNDNAFAGYVLTNDTRSTSIETNVTNLTNNKVDKTSNQTLHNTDALRVSGTTLSLYKGDGSYESITTQDTIYTHPTSGVTAGTYKSVTVDANGHITAGTNPTTLVGYGITDAATSGHSHTDASTTVSGFMSASDKVKLNSLSNYSKPASEPISYITGLQTALGDKVDKLSKQSLDLTSALRVSGTTVSLYKGDGTFDSITTQDTIYTLPTATSTVKGGIEIFSDTVQTTTANAVSTSAGRTYGIQLNSAGQAVVNVPWSDTNTVYTHPNSGVTAGTYSKVTVDTQGHITNGSSLSASDIPSLDASKITSGIIDSARLPSFVDDVLEFVNLAGFPATGEAGKIYIALDTNKTYRWSGSTYVYITSGAVDSVAGKTGIITLVKGDVGLGNVDNTSDLNKPISTATQNALNLKVDKVSGKQLSTEDYTTAEKTKLSGLNNYTKPVSEPISYITGLQTALDSKVSKTGVEALHSTDALRISGTTLSLYKGDGTFESVVTQDTVYTLPKASATTLGGIKVGSNLSIDANGVLNASATSSISWTNITDKPTNISGYGITDAYTKTEVGTLAEFTTNLG